MTLRPHTGIAPLAQHLKGAHRHRVGQIEGAGGVLIDHRQSHATVGVIVEQPFGQTLGLLTEHQIGVVRVGYVGMDVFRLGGKI